jgi:hypothetical protein
MGARGQLSAREARRLAIVAQGLGTPRPSGATPPTRARLGRLLDQLGTIQLDAVNVLARTQYLVPFSRLGSFDPARLLSLTGPGAPWFEYWGHAASLLPVELYPLLRWRMDEHERSWHPHGAEWLSGHRDYMAAALDEVTARGPLAAGELSDPRRRSGEWWGRRSDGRLALEYLFGTGLLAAWRSTSFERVYDLPERVIPAAVLARPVPTADEAQRELVYLAARALGVATVADLANYFGLGPVAKPRVAELVEAGRLVTVAVEGWGQPGYMPPDATAPRLRRAHATLLSPFDSLIWRRDRTERLFGFRYRIEIYVPAPRRTYGYYVLPLLLGDELVARFDLKADRQTRRLRVMAAHIEPTATAATVLVPAAAELELMASWLGLGAVSVGPRGNLAASLRKAVAARRTS